MDMDGAAGDSLWVDETPPRKRRRVALACSSCRDRKVRCDGMKPVCSQCKKRDSNASDCVYTLLANTAKRVSEQEYIASLQQKVHRLQQAAGATDQGVCSSIPTGNAIPLREMTGETVQTNSSRSSHNDLRFDQSRTGSSDTPSCSGSILVPPQYSSPDPSHRHQNAQQLHTPQRSATGDDHHGPSPISAMGVTIPSHDEELGHVRADEFYGESSVVSLVRGIAQPPRRRRGRPQRESNLGSERDAPSSLLQEQFSLPPRGVADMLLGLYFSSCHIFYPWTHSVSFREAYNRLWTESTSTGIPPREDDSPDIGLGGNNCPRHVFFSALNAMFAMGCEFSDFPPEEKKAASSMFFERMSQLIRFDILDRGNMAHIQALLLVGQYLLCTHYPARCWNVVGLACRMAVGLGLQSPHFSEQSSGLEAEMRRRVWYACVQMDMTISMTLGRPPSLRTVGDVPLPLAVDDEYWALHSDTGCQPPGVHSRHIFNVQNIKLAKILGEILERVYHPPHKTEAQAGHKLEDLPGILALDSELNSLEASFPDIIHWERGNGLNVPLLLKRQCNVLHARFLHMKILLYRPSFTVYCASVHSRQAREEAHATDNSSSTGEGDLAGQLRVQCAVACVKRTYELVTSLEKANLTRATGAWWFSLFYLLTSAIVLIIAECTEPLMSLLDKGMLQTAWRSCLATLDVLSHAHPLASRYRQSLESLRERSLSVRRSPDLPTKGRIHRLSDQQPMGPGDSTLRPPDEGNLERQVGDTEISTGAMHQGETGLRGIREPTDFTETGGGWEFAENDYLGGTGFDISALLGSGDADLTDLLMPQSGTDFIEYGYPLGGLL